MSASPVIGVPSQQHQPNHHFHNDNLTASPQPARQPLPSSGRRPTATAAMRQQDKTANATAGRGAGGLIRLEIYMDLLCPWCFIEKHSLDALMQRYTEEHPEVRFEVAYKPYYIAQTMAKRELLSLLLLLFGIVHAQCSCVLTYKSCTRMDDLITLNLS